MPKREDIKNILLIGSGPIVIGQACEFDYSGTQAAKTLKSLGYKVVLINSNPATIMTDPTFAHSTYIEPITKEVIKNIIDKENIDAILPTMGGQTALNVAMQMQEEGLLDGVTFLGANPSAIKKGEDRALFKEAMLKIGMDLPKSFYAYNEDEALNAAQKIGFPLMIRASYTLAGGGSGVAYNVEEFKELAKSGLDISPINEILIEESLLGWKEYEMEVIRDRLDNCIIVCSIENLDPMGVHTGDSITIAPALTLSDKEYQRMRDASFAILREIGVDTGGSNVQFAINPTTGRMIVIEMNPRVSRSSALASKATGYPIAKVATLLAVGFSLDEIKNDITSTPASFEPSIDYIVTKIPRFTFEKFPKANSTLTTSMKSIGEVMAIGGTFKESLQKAICSLEMGFFGFNRISKDLEAIKNEIRRPNANRLLYIAEGFGLGLDVEQMYNLCKIDRWFLTQIKEIIESEKLISVDILTNKDLMRHIKSQGFSDKNIAFWLKQNEDLDISEDEVYLAREKLGVELIYHKVDTCAAEFNSSTSYLYSSIGDFNSLDVIESSTKESNQDIKKVLIIGSGPNRIGQGIEFDYACVHASFALKDIGIKSIMYNCNPETVSTDYDTSDVLYFEPIDFEHVRSVIKKENPDGVIVHFGGQTPLKLAKSLTKINAKIIGTSPKVIDIAEDREKFAAFIKELGLNQPENGIAFKEEEAFSIANNIGYPVLVRPSYVLGGRAMRIVYNNTDLKAYMEQAVAISEDKPILIDKFLQQALELDVDVISDTKDIYIGAILEHIEEAGIHSGDSACFLPTRSIDSKMLLQIQKISSTIALKLGVKGLMNIQFAIYKNEIYIIEVNPRASRTVPFISKATSIPLTKVATLVMCDIPLKEALNRYDDYGMVISKDLGEFSIYTHKPLNYTALKEAVFPFNKLPGADLLLGPEMKSTGEVMGISKDYGICFAKSQISCKNLLPTKGKIFISLQDVDKPFVKDLARELVELGFEILATQGTNKFLQDSLIPSTSVLKISEGRPNIVDKLLNEEIAMVINTSSDERTRSDARLIREAVLRANIPYFTTLSGARSACIAIKSMQKNHLDGGLHENLAFSLQDFLAGV